MELIYISILFISLFLLIGINYNSFFVLITISMFLEHEFFWIKESSMIPFNLRPSYIVTFIGLLYLLPNLIKRIKKDFKFKSHHKFLLLYYLYCLILLFIKPTFPSIEHFGQISIGIFLYFSFIILIRNKDFKLIYNVFLLGGIGQLIIGILQLISGISTIENIYDLNNFVQHLDLVPYGRPFGTFVEPDFYGSICTFFAFIFLGEYSKKSSKVSYFVATLFLVLLFYSAVRASIIGFMLSILILLFILRDRIKITRVEKILVFYSLIISIPIFYTTFIRFSYFLKPEFWSEGFMNPRVLQMGMSFSQFLENPIFGNGLNAYRFLGSQYSNLIEDWMPDWVISGYDPSLITSLLNDTGLIGFVLFMAFLSHYFKAILIHGLKRNIFVFCAILSLIISYLFTNGLPFVFTWIFIAMVELYSRIEDKKSYDI